MGAAVFAAGPVPLTTNPSHRGLVVKVPGPVAKGATPGTHIEGGEPGIGTTTANGLPDKCVGRTTANG
jgi:hypothetical protein